MQTVKTKPNHYDFNFIGNKEKELTSLQFQFKRKMQPISDSKLSLLSSPPIGTKTRITPEPSKAFDPESELADSSSSLYTELDSLIRRVSGTSEEKEVASSPKREPLSLHGSSDSIDREFESLSQELMLFGDMEECDLVPVTNRLARTLSPVRSSSVDTRANHVQQQSRSVARVTSWTSKMPVRLQKNIVIGERSVALKAKQHRLRASSSPPTARIERNQRHFPIPPPSIVSGKQSPVAIAQEQQPREPIAFTSPKRVCSLLRDSNIGGDSTSKAEIHGINDGNLSPASKNAYEKFGLFGLVQRMGQKNTFQFAKK